MAQLVVAGASVGGLATAALAVRAGHSVTLLERDPSEPPASVGAAWDDWHRRGVQQFRQLHGYQALAREILTNSAPDILEALYAAGAHDADLLVSRPDARGLPGTDELVQLRCRRPTLEWVLRRAVETDERVTLRSGTDVTGLLADDRGACVIGVRTSAGDVRADVAVDATGRRSRMAAWCEGSRLPRPEETSIGTEQVYYTRWFRRDAPFSGTDPAVRVELAFATLLLVPADDGWFSATFFAPARDAELQQVLRSPDGFVRAVTSIAPAAPWLESGDATPQGDVLFLGKLANHLRGGAPVPGLVSIADAAVCTNPTWGRGVALAFAHAAELVQVLGAVDEAGVAAAFEESLRTKFAPWFHDTVALDAEINARWALAPGESGASPDAFRPQFTHHDALAATRSDPDVFVAYTRYRNLLDPPDAFWTDPDVAARVRTATAGAPSAVLAEPSREDLLVSAARA